MLPVLGALIAGVAIVGLVLSLVSGRTGPPSLGVAPSSTHGTNVTLAERPLDDFLDRWERSLVGPYVATGTLTRIRGRGADAVVEDSVGFRLARRDDRELDQLGSFAIVTAAGRQRDCQIDDTASAGSPERVLCSAPVPEGTNRQERDLLARELADYQVFETDDPDCLELIAVGPSNFGRWGQSSMVCFDPATHAVRLMETFRGDDRSVRVVETLSDSPSDTDLEPG